MAWVKLDDGFSEHPKIVKVGKLGGFAQVEALCYANRNLTDGFIPMKIACGFASKIVRSKLVAVKLWDEVPEGYQIHDYSDYQQTKAQILASRAAVAERVKRHRNAVTPAVTPEACNGVGNAAPVKIPSREEEDPKEKKEDSARALVAVYNETVTRLPKVQTLSTGRRTHASARLRARPDLKWWRSVFQAAEATPFYRGENDRGWVADFDYFIRNDENAERVLGQAEARNAAPPEPDAEQVAMAKLVFNAGRRR